MLTRRFCRGQLLSIDYFISLGALVFTFLLIILTWQHISAVSNKKGLTLDLERVVSINSLALLSQSGTPSSWYVYENLSSVSVIGLSKPEGYILSMDRLFALNTSTFNQTELTSLLGFTGPSYSYFITATGQNLSFVHGNLPSSDSSQVAVREYTLYNGSEFIQLRFGVWV